MSNHIVKESVIDHFLLKTGKWEGFGTIIILQTGAAIHFTLDWKVRVLENGTIEIAQVTCLTETEECWQSTHFIKDIQDNKFLAELYNPLYGNFHGNGMLSQSEISWRLYDEEERTVSKTQLSLMEDGRYLLNCAYQFKGTVQISIGGILFRS